MAQDLPLTAADLVCVDDLDAFGSETTSDLESLRQDIFHILIESPGSNPDDTTRGIGVEQLLSGTLDQLQAVVPAIESQLTQDDRIDQAKASLTQLPPDSRLPDGTPMPNGGYLLDVSVVAGASVIGLQLGFDPSGVLLP